VAQKPRRRRVQPEVYFLDKEVGRDDRLAPGALAYDGGVVADAERE
jgi:hypothetical protein